MNDVHAVIIRHRKENVAKCSLKGLESRQDLLFFRYPLQRALDLRPYILLDMDGEVLGSADTAPFILLDATWRYATVMRENIPGLRGCRKRRIPYGWKTAYPRYQTGCADPERGLASIEALFIAFHCTGRDPAGLFDHYRWKAAFLEKNSPLLFPATPALGG